MGACESKARQGNTREDAVPEARNQLSDDHGGQRWLPILRRHPIIHICVTTAVQQLDSDR